MVFELGKTLQNLKQTLVSINPRSLQRELDRKKEIVPEVESVRDSIFSLGEDPRVFSKKEVGTPALFLVEIIKDGLNNPVIKLNWKISKSEVRNGDVVGFNVYRKKLNRNEENSQGIDLKKFDISDFEKISRGSKKRGKFSSDRKSITNIRRGLIPSDVLNLNLRNQESKSLDSGFERTPRIFEKIAYIDYSQFLLRAKQKRVFIQNSNFADLTFLDKTVGYGETFEYYIKSVTKKQGETNASNRISVHIINPTFPRMPQDVKYKQIDETSIQVLSLIDSRDQIKFGHFFRKSELDVEYKKLTSLEVKNDKVALVDSSVAYGKKYSYRLFLEDIYGNVSQPKEIKTFSTTQTVTSKSRSNILKNPVFSAEQDQNSDSIKITISPNDFKALYYLLERKDLTIYEKSFSNVSKNETNYGGEGWETNKFFVAKGTERITNAANALNRQNVLKKIEFLDNTVSTGHIYQYRICGFDLYGNKTSCQFATVKSVGKKTSRKPINLRTTVLRKFPFRVKLEWDDDNVSRAQDLSNVINPNEKLSSLDEENKIYYKVQRRKADEEIWETFPFTENSFIIDEVSAKDFVKFSSKKTEDVFTEVLQNISIIQKGKGVERASYLPDFLIDKEVYLYRISTINKETGEESNFSEEIKVNVIQDLSEPLNFSAMIENKFLKPRMVKLLWSIQPFKFRPDHWTIERKVESALDNFVLIGKAYLTTEFIDSSAESGKRYIYRIKSKDLLGRESKFFEAKVSV